MEDEPITIQEADSLIDEAANNAWLAWQGRDYVGWWMNSAALLGFRIGRWILVRRGRK